MVFEPQPRKESFRKESALNIALRHLAVVSGALMAVSLTLPAMAACRFDATIVVEGPSKTRLPTGAKLSLTIFDSNLADAPISASAVASVDKRVGGQRFPIRVPVKVRSDKQCPIWPSVSANIEQRGKLMFTNDTQTRVTPGKRSVVKLVAVNR